MIDIESTDTHFKKCKYSCINKFAKIENLREVRDLLVKIDKPIRQLLSVSPYVLKPSSTELRKIRKLDVLLGDICRVYFDDEIGFPEVSNV